MSRYLALAALLVASIGCTQNTPVAEVSGKVIRKGAAAVSGKVLFLPLGGGKQAIGAIQPDGTFRLSTFAKDDGALIGEHHAVLIKVVFSDALNQDSSFQAPDDQRLAVTADAKNEFTLDLSATEWRPLMN